MKDQSIRVGVDVGGTFTDFALEKGGKIHTTKILTTPDAPERAILEGLDILLQQVGLKPSDIDVLIHGTTLATNAIIERKGARTAMLTTEGFRDVIELGKENRFDQYDLNIDKPEPLVPRYLRFGVPERLSAKGEVLLPLDVDTLNDIAERLIAEEIESVAICFLHGFIDPQHEQKAAQVLQSLVPNLQISLSSEVAPEIREYERFSTTVANAYVQPKISDYLQRLKTDLGERGYTCPVYLFLSSGGLTELETARQFPIRLVESGPAGGAILACHLAKECGIDRLLSFDMGGTTAKICLIDAARPQMSRTFEMGRVYRFKEGSGIPVKIPVIEMVEIGAGGGSIVHVDNLQRIRVGPESAASDPGPACYDLGGTDATVTDANVVLGRIAPEGFAGGRMQLSRSNAEQALKYGVGDTLNLSVPMSAYGASEIVEEDMANAAREHATESGKSLDERTMIAFGGGAPAHAVRLAHKLGIDRVLIPKNAGVGSAVGFLRAPMSYEISRSARFLMSQFNADKFNTAFVDISSTAHQVLERGSLGEECYEQRLAYMRYVGQGYEVPVEIPNRQLDESDVQIVVEGFDRAYRKLYERTLQNLDIEIVGLSVAVSTRMTEPSAASLPANVGGSDPCAAEQREVFNPETNDFDSIPVYARDDLFPGAIVESPLIVREDNTTTTVPAGYRMMIDSNENMIIEKRLA